MALSNIKSRKAILSAIKECNKLGRDAFLAKYGFGRARRYFLTFDRKLYDSKAIMGVAHRYEFPNEGPLKSSEFSGGEATVKRKLEELGFKTRGPAPRARPVRSARIRSRKPANNLQSPPDQLETALKKCRKTAQRGYKIAKASLQESAKAIDKAKKDLLKGLKSVEGKSVRTSGIIPQLKNQLSEVVNNLDELKRISASELEERHQRLDNFSITLFGRTMAGKSTLMEILTRGDGQSIGKGGQRTTRDVRSYSWNGLKITDVPGIAAFEGEVDAEIAFKAASQADLVLFLITDDAPQAVEPECLAKVLRLGKPVLGICNVKVAVNDEDDLQLFLKNPDKSFAQTRLDQLFNQFHAFADQHVPGARVPFAVTHLLSRSLAEQPKFATHRDQLLKASRFEGIESQIIREVVDRGTFLRVKNFIDGTVVPMMDVTDRLLEFSAQNTSSWRVMSDKCLKFKKWEQKFRIDGQDQIKALVSKEMDILRNEAASFAEEHFEDPSADESWKKRVKCSGINSKIEKLQKDLINKFTTGLSEIARELKAELRRVSVSSCTDHLRMDKIFDSQRALNWGTIATSCALTIAAVCFPSISVPLVAAATFTGIGGRLISRRIKSGEEKRNQARKNLKQQLMQDIAKKEQKVRRQLSDWLNQKLLGEQIKERLTDLTIATSCLSNLADTQRTLAWLLNDRQKTLDRILAEEALIQLRAQKLKDSIVDVARVPGQATMLLIEPHTTFPGQTRIGLKLLLGEEILFATATKNRRSLFAQVIGKGCDPNTIRIEKNMGVAHIPLDDLGPDAKTRIQLAQQLTGLHVIRKET